MNKQSIAIIILSLIIISGLSYWGYNYEKSRWLNEGYNQGAIQTINQIQQTMNLPYFSNETGNITLKSIPIKQLCQEMSGWNKEYQNTQEEA